MAEIHQSMYQEQKDQEGCNNPVPESALNNNVEDQDKFSYLIIRNTVN